MSRMSEQSASIKQMVLTYAGLKEEPFSRGEVINYLEQAGQPVVPAKVTYALNQLVKTGEMVRTGSKRGAKYSRPIRIPVTV